MNIGMAKWLLVTLTCTCTAAPARAEAETPWTLNDLAWLTGGTWAAESRTADGAAATTEVSYRWASDGKAIAYTLLRRVRATGAIDTTIDGLCGWHPEKKRVVLWEFDSQGNLTEGVFGEGGHLDEVIHSADGASQPVRSAIIRESDDRFRFSASVEREGAWVVVFEAEYTRQDNSP